MQERRLQVFVSSTYQDLKEERQAAVQAILGSGHIPAGMELFAAGDEGQMEVIKRWIEESDVFFLLLGGRYGSIEPKTGKSYVHLEYDHAREIEKPYFCVVMDESIEDQRVKERGKEVIERDHRKEYLALRTELTTKDLVGFWQSPKDIQLAVYRAMGEFTRREDLIGWVRGDRSYNAEQVAGELARLTAENTRLRALAEREKPNEAEIGGLLFEQWRNLLLAKAWDPKDAASAMAGCQHLDKIGIPNSKLTILHFVWVHRAKLAIGKLTTSLVSSEDSPAIAELTTLGLAERSVMAGQVRWKITEIGKRLVRRLEHQISVESRQPAPAPSESD